MQTVNAQPGRQTAVALLLAAGLIAVLIGAVFASAPGVGAHDCDGTTDQHVDPVGVPCIDMTNHDPNDHPRIRLDPAEGPRGTDFTFKGWGFPEGTVTIFEGDMENGVILDTEIVDPSGSFTSDPLTVRGSPGNLEYEVTAIDSEGRATEAVFTISKETISFEPHTAVKSSTLKIIVADWQGDMSTGVAAVRIGGKDALISEAIEYGNCIEYTHRRLADSNNVLTLDVTVPPDTLTGIQTVSLYDYDQLVLTGASGSPIPPPCTEGQDKGTRQGTVTAELLADPTPIIKKTVAVIKQDEAAPSAPEQNIITVDGGRDRELALKAYPPNSTNIHLDASDQIEISLPEFDLSGASFESTGESGVIRISGTVLSPAQIHPDAPGGKLTLTLPNAVSVSARSRANLSTSPSRKAPAS